jgi:hypothetical protein
MPPWMGPGAHDRHLDDEVVEARGLRRGSIDICARLSIWKTPDGVGRQMAS